MGKWDLLYAGKYGKSQLPDSVGYTCSQSW